ncbi:MAG: hypothetical protein M1561_07435 [Gammaproteobacteria bacterium]|nr:hypothetical protein [Gammaproteobacteria bacterium]
MSNELGADNMKTGLWNGVILQRNNINSLKNNFNGFSYKLPNYIYWIGAFVGIGAAIWLQFTKFGFDPNVMFSTFGGGVTFIGIDLTGAILISIAIKLAGMLLSWLFDWTKSLSVHEISQRSNKPMTLEIFEPIGELLQKIRTNYENDRSLDQNVRNELDAVIGELEKKPGCYDIPLQRLDSLLFSLDQFFQKLPQEDGRLTLPSSSFSEAATANASTPLLANSLSINNTRLPNYRSSDASLNS